MKTVIQLSDRNSTGVVEYTYVAEVLRDVNGNIESVVAGDREHAMSFDHDTERATILKVVTICLDSDLDPHTSCYVGVRIIEL